MTSTAKPAVAAAAAKPTVAANLAKSIEGVWLVVALLLPIAAFHESLAIVPSMMPKVFLMRTAAIALLVLMVAHWALRDRSQTAPAAGAQTAMGALARDAVTYAKRQPVVAAAVAVVLVNVGAAAIAPVPAIAFFGINPGFDSYSVASVGSYFVLFLALALHLRQREQLARLVWVLTAGAMLASLHGIGQHFGIDFLRPDPEPVERIWATFGNPIFAASYLLMTVPLALGLWQTREGRMGMPAHVLIGAGLIALQITAIAFTLSRGPLVALAGGLVLFIAMAGWLFRGRAVVNAGASVAFAVLFALVMSYIPVDGVSGGGASLDDRLGTLGTLDVDRSGLGTRTVIWRESLWVYLHQPWVDTTEFPEIPSDGLALSRYAFGYGPEHFGYIYPLGGNDTSGTDVADHGHNFLVHTLLELGLLGVLDYVALALAVAWVLLRLVFQAKRGALEPADAWLVLALVAVLAARVVEQLVGKAQVADLALMWMLMGVVVALPAIVASRRAVPSGAAPIAEAAPRRRADRRKEQLRRPASVRVSPVRLGLIGLLVVVALPVWWTAVVQPAQASIAVASGLRAGSAGNQKEALDSMQRAVGLSRGAEYTHWYLASGWLETSKAYDDPADEAKALLLADEAIEGAFARDPINWRPRMLEGVITRRRAVLDASFKQEAIHDYELVVELLPAFWEQWEQLAWTLTSVGEHERALDVVEHAKDLGGRENDAAYFLYYVEGKAHQALGHDEEVARILDVLESIDNPLTEPLIADLSSPS